MVKNKSRRTKQYARFIRPEIRDIFLNKWSNNQEHSEDLKVVSILFEAESNTLIQLIVSQDEVYNGIFKIKEFKFGIKDNEYSIEIIDLEDIYAQDDVSYEQCLTIFPQLIEEYKIIIPEQFIFAENPLKDYPTYPKLILE